MLAVVASQALHVTDAGRQPALEGFVELIRSYVPPVNEDRMLGPELARLTEAITRRSSSADPRIDSTSA